MTTDELRFALERVHGFVPLTDEQLTMCINGGLGDYRLTTEIAWNMMESSRVVGEQLEVELGDYGKD